MSLYIVGVILVYLGYIYIYIAASRLKAFHFI